MKRWNRILAALLAATMLCAASVTPVLADEENVLDDGGVILPAQGAEEEGLEIDPEALPEMPEEIGLDLDDDMALSGNFDLVGDEGAIVLPGEEGLAGTEANDSSDFEIENGVLVKYKGEGGDVVIPDGVTSIGEIAFYQCTSLTSVTIPNSVTSIGSNAFIWCTSLASVTIPNSVTNLGDGVFYQCTSLASVTIPNGVTSIGVGTFYNCTSLTSVTIPNSVTSIGAHAFRSCTSLTSVTIPNSVSSIREYAFMECTSLTSVTIPNSVTSIGAQAFRSCTSLTSVTIPKNVTSVEEAVFWECTSLTSVTIPNSVTQIGRWAFGKCNSLTSVTIPNNVTSIGSNAFIWCTSLASVTIPDSVTSIEVGVFSYCSNLSRVTIPNNVTSIGAQAFRACNSLTSVTIPNSVNSIGELAFHDCTSLTSVTIPNGVTSIERELFWNCSSLTSITIPNSVTSIRAYAFTGCSSLTSVTIPDSVTGIGVSVFWNCSSLTGITIPNSVTSIGERAFWSCSSMTSAIILSKKITFGEKVFDKSPNVTMHIISDSDAIAWAKENGIPYDIIKISDSSLKLKIGETHTLTVNGFDSSQLTWSSSNKKVATVSEGKVKAVGAGKCVISAKIKNGKTLKCKVTVTDPAKLSKTILTMKAGDSQTLKVSGLAGRSVSWSSSNKKVATVSGGKVKAVGAGKCVISAKIKNGKPLKCKVTVTDPAKLSKTRLTISAVDSATIKLTGVSGKKVTWTSSKSGVARISKSDSGSVTVVGVKPGTAVIQAKIAGGQTLKCTVKVVAPMEMTMVKIVNESGKQILHTRLANRSGKNITYIKFDILQYDSRNQRLVSPYKGGFDLSATIKAHASTTKRIDVNNQTDHVKYNIEQIRFSDGTTWKP